MYAYLHKLKKEVNAAHDYNYRNPSIEEMSQVEYSKECSSNTNFKSKEDINQIEENKDMNNFYPTRTESKS